MWAPSRLLGSCLGCSRLEALLLVAGYYDACDQWAFCSLSASDGARAYYDAHNPQPDQTAKHARRKLANKLIKILHGVLRQGTAYDEQIAWTHWRPDTQLSAAA